jgi:hypothetical protein
VCFAGIAIAEQHNGGELGAAVLILSILNACPSPVRSLPFTFPCFPLREGCGGSVQPNMTVAVGWSKGANATNLDIANRKR